MMLKKTMGSAISIHSSMYVCSDDDAMRDLCEGIVELQIDYDRIDCVP